MLETDVYCTYDDEKCIVQQIKEHNDKYMKKFGILHKVYLDLIDPWGRYKRVSFVNCSGFYQAA